MSRSYKGVRLKKNRVFLVIDLQNELKCCANTVSNLVKAGLRSIDGRKPYLFRGLEVNAFLEYRRKRSRFDLEPGEFFAFCCKIPVFPDINTLEEMSNIQDKSVHLAGCPECGKRVSKITSQADWDFFYRQRNPNTTKDSLHEQNSSEPSGIGKRSEKIDQNYWTTNDRVLHKWQTYAGRYSEKTIDRHLAAIRFCEGVLQGKSFYKLTIEDINKVRIALKQSLTTTDESRKKSKSTVAHTASHIRAFLEWLIEQDGFKRLPRDLPSYLTLQKSMYAASLPQKPKEYPSLKEAEELLLRMPSRTLKDLRARAMFAIAFLGALRADTLISLRICHFDPKNRRIVQDATMVRSKNGKSLNIFWFPIPECFSTEVSAWVEKLKQLGCDGHDALFPSLASLEVGKNIKDPNRDPIEPMSTTHAVTEAFSIASKGGNVNYTPHSAKHTLAAERDARPLTRRQRKAWSENMGHENEQTTDIHYGKISDAERGELFKEIREGRSNKLEMTNEQKIALFDEFLLKVSGP